MATMPSLAAFYIVLISCLPIVQFTHAQTEQALTQDQIQALYFMHVLIKNYPQIKTYIDNADKLPDNVTDVTMNPLAGILLSSLQNLAENSQPEVGKLSNNSSPEVGNSTDIATNTTNLTSSGSSFMTSLLENPILQNFVKALVKQVSLGMLDARINNKTLGNDISSYLSLIQPIDAIRTALTMYSTNPSFLTAASDYVNNDCYKDIVLSIDGLAAGKSWAVEMFDAQGKIESGVERGAFYFVGSYDQCYRVNPVIDSDTTYREFKTRFCRVDIAITQSLIDSLNIDTHGVHLKLTWGLCLPDTCHGHDVKGLFDLEPLKRLNLTIEGSYCEEEKDVTKDTSAVAAISVLSVFGFLILAGTTYDLYRAATKPKHGANGHVRARSNIYVNGITKDEHSNYGTYTQNGQKPSSEEGQIKTVNSVVIMEKENEINNQTDTEDSTVTGNTKPQNETSFQPIEPVWVQFLVCFSLYTNMPKILSAKSSPGSVTCIHGIRFLSLTWVVLGHTYNYGIISHQDTFTIKNLLDAVPIMQRFTFETVVGGGFAVDTFFVLSAFLLTWLQLKDIHARKKKISINIVIMYYFHRFWRLTPIYMMVLMMFGCLYHYLGDGPFWPQVIWAAEHCKTNWWTNLLYINNLVQTDSACMGWSWYLANDMQFYVISPLFIVFMYKLPIFGFILTSVLLCLGMSMSFWKEYEANGTFFTMISDGGSYWKSVYIAPWCRVGAWAVGMLLGFIVHQRGRKPIQTKRLIFAGWAVFIAIGMTIIYSPYNENKKDGEEWSNVSHAFYEAVGRPAWALCISWVIFACYNNMGGLINSFLSWNGFIPLSRLSYAAYLVHPICMMIYFASRRTLFYITDYNIIYLFLGHLSITYMVAFLCSLAYEAPALGLEKLLFRRKR
ncbi:hypothetical protein ACF0H5_019154 [Mactra antiquata]